MHHDGGLLNSLHEGRHDGILHQHRQRSSTPEVVGSDGHAGLGATNDHLAQTLAHVLAKEGGKEGGREGKREG